MAAVNLKKPEYDVIVKHRQIFCRFIGFISSFDFESKEYVYGAIIILPISNPWLWKYDFID